jgi:ribosomal protein S18 acetylase RimI-like enzyme
MKSSPESGIGIEVNMDAAIEIIRHVGAWMRETGAGNYSKWWDPNEVDAEKLLKYVKPDDFYVVLVDGQPAGMAVIQPNQTLQDWSSIDESTPPPKAIYVDYVAVEREFAGRGLVKVLMGKAEDIARQSGAAVIRLDTNGNEPKLCELYEGLGFQRVGAYQEETYLNAFYEKPMAAN